MRAMTTAVRYVQQPCDTRKWYLASTTTVHEQQKCLNCFCVIFLCTARPRQAETNYHRCNTSTCCPNFCPNFSRPRPPCGYLAAARQAMCNPDECTPWYMSSLPYLTAAQQKLLLQTFHDGDDQGLRHAPPTATTVDASSTLPYYIIAESWWRKSPRSCRKHRSLCGLCGCRAGSCVHECTC